MLFDAISTSVKEMRKAIWAVWGHSCSTDDEPMHWFCPTNPNTWCKYNAAINNNLQNYKHKPSVAKAVRDVIKPVFADLSHPALLKKCLGGKTQNPNESLNSLIWKFCPKTIGSSLQIAEIAANLATSVFNDGNQILISILEKFGLKINRNVCVSLAERDNRRIFTSRQRCLQSSFEARRAKKIKKSKEIELFQEQEAKKSDPCACSEPWVHYRENFTKQKRSLRLSGLSPEFGLLEENSRERTKMPTEQEAKPPVVSPSLEQWGSLSTFRGAPGEDPFKWLKEYDRVAKFNKWDDMMCLANVYFFLESTARQWYVNNKGTLDSWEAFKNGLSGRFGDRQKYTRRAEEQLKCRSQRSGESTQSIQSVLGLCQEVNHLMIEDEKVSHLMKGVAEDIYQALLTREINDIANFIKWCNYIEDMKQKRVGRKRFERLPNVVPVTSLADETDLVSLIRTIVREEVHRLLNQTQESLDSDSPILRRDRSRRS
ncbi:retrotrans_gag domain-containing protein [Trichonephila clavipes]|uniref:Retrotrans_gag domain-containing protein n=1 Tax=Trichonephila clavipes TaxID=2585209 RepID=A0A8X6VNQ1_TRICX|nr:retrotrans_gag domain-containing protein [Trichonephila clavipes]